MNATSANTSELKYFPFEPITPSSEPYKPAMGLKPLDLKHWIEIDSTFESQLAQKAQSLNTHKDLVLQWKPEATKAILETQHLLLEHLLKKFPEYYSFAHQSLKVQRTQRSFKVSQDPEDALKNLSQWVQEDFAFMSSDSPSRLVAGCICFPSRWNLLQKMNMNSDGIHGPVPKYQETVAKSTAQFLEKIQVEKPMWRLNWTLHDSKEIFTPFPEQGRSDLTAENILSACYLRVERQTLQRLPLSQYVLFSIRTYIHPVSEIIKDVHKKNILAQNLQHLPEDTAAYKGMKTFFQLLKTALQ